MPRRSTRTRSSRPSVALHIPWDKVDDYADLRRHAEDLGVSLGTINSNTFQDDDYKFGALTHDDDRVRSKAIDHHLECIDIMDATGSRDLKIWLAEGSNYPGQADIRGRQDRLQESLQKIYDRLSDEQRLVLEYKFFEPAFYHTDVPDWGTSYAQVAALGDRAMVCLDTGHHAPGTNIEFIVMQLLRLGKLGSFDFNSRFYADDDLIVGAADPFQLFRIIFEVIRGGGLNNPDVAFMLDQCHNVEKKIPGQIRSVLNVQEMTARALLVDRDALAAAQQAERRARRERRLHGRVLHRRAPRPRRVARVARTRRPTRWPRTRHPATSRRSRRTASAARRPAGARRRTSTGVRDADRMGLRPDPGRATPRTPGAPPRPRHVPPGVGQTRRIRHERALLRRRRTRARLPRARAERHRTRLGARRRVRVRRPRHARVRLGRVAARGPRHDGRLGRLPPRARARGLDPDGTGPRRTPLPRGIR